MNELIQQLFDTRQQITDANKVLTSLKAEKKDLETRVFEQLNELGVDGTKIRGVGSVSITEAIVPQAEDWDAFYDYVMQDKMRFLLLNKALNAATFREALTIEGDIPGLTSYTRRTLSVTKAA